MNKARETKKMKKGKGKAHAEPTKGEWEACLDWPQERCVFVVGVGEIAFVRSKQNWEGDDEDMKIGEAEADANAVLLAAAKDLAESLKEMYVSLTDLYKDQRGKDEYLPAGQYFGAAMHLRAAAALKKAGVKVRAL